MGRKWGFHSGKLNAFRAEIADTLTVLGNLAFGDASTDTLVVNGSMTAAAKVIFSGTTATSGADAVAVTGSIHEVTTTGTGDALTLIDGTEGQRLVVAYIAEGAGGDTAILTPTSFGGGATITFNAIGDSADLIFTNSNWYMIGGTAVVA